MVAHAGVSTSAMKKYRGVRQRQWGSWVSEIRHSLSKTRVWLGTFDTAKKAAKAYDEAARLMEGPNAKTNFPTPAGASGTPALLSAAVRAKLLQCTLRGPKPAQRCSGNPSTTSTRSTTMSSGQTLVCLRLDDTQDQLGVTWQATSDARPRWVTTLHVPTAAAADTPPNSATSSPTKPHPAHNRHDLGAQIQQMGALQPPTLPLDCILTAADLDQLAEALQPPSPCSSNDDGTNSWFLPQEHKHEHVDDFDSSAVAAAAALFTLCEHEQSSSPFLVDYGCCDQVYEQDDSDLGLCFPQQQLWL